MAMHPAMLAALRARNPVLAYLLRIELPGRTIRLLDGAGFAVWGEEVFTGEDPEFGKLQGFGDFIEVEGTEAPRLSIGLLPKGNAAIAALTAPGSQGSPVSVYAAAIDPQTGAIIGIPDAKFIGELDDAAVTLDQNSTLLELEVSSIWERLFDDNEGNRWNDTFWKSLFGPDVRGFEHVVNAGRDMYWGYNGPVSGSGGSSYGGSGSILGGDRVNPARQ